MKVEGENTLEVGVTQSPGSAKHLCSQISQNSLVMLSFSSEKTLMFLVCVLERAILFLR